MPTSSTPKRYTMTDDYEKEIFSQDLALSVKEIEKIIQDFFSKGIDAHGIKWQIEIIGIKQILVLYQQNQIISPENKVPSGHFEINPINAHSDRPVHLKIVSFRSELDSWWLELSQVIQTVSVMPGVFPSLITGISRELLTKITASNLPETQNKPEKPKKPEMPEKRSGLDNWYRYYHACKGGGWNITLENIAQESGYTPGYIRNNHAAYKRKQGY
ncbi:MAG: hypothetical protein JJE09_13265 [Bacteroidia bacterium]|nr:hypothetical protein [Bacteroidia bacterium]